MKRTYGVTRAASGIGATTAAPGQRALGRSSGVSLPLGDDALAFVPMPIASDLHDALWAKFVVQALPAVLQHCHPAPAFPCRGARRCHSRGCRLVLWGAGNPR